ncbi:unnamed protein product [Amoebophrya sp. A25]|nr:unnamed protein product [Amoebophrya sp. A25]|eukprot:GSA25T00023041001.1
MAVPSSKSQFYLYVVAHVRASIVPSGFSRSTYFELRSPQALMPYLEQDKLNN